MSFAIPLMVDSIRLNIYRTNLPSTMHSNLFENTKRIYVYIKDNNRTSICTQLYPNSLSLTREVKIFSTSCLKAPFDC